jgi:putative NIF3 family GTP cyclohydrolase 1 type 2
MTAQEVVARIQQKLADGGIAWRTQTVDTFKAGRPDVAVRGIATTGMATLDVLRRASAAGRNFVVTHEPTFYNHLDQTSTLERDTTYQAKLQFIQDQGLAVWRFHDHSHMLRPDPLVAGSARVLGLTPYASQTERGVYVVPETTLRALAADAARRTGGRAIRVCGDPEMKLTRIALGPGYGVPPLTQKVDVVIGGEASESGGQTAYALDAMALGHARAVILLGHMMSEDFGMREVADWLRTFLADLPVDWIPAGEPFGAPRA